MKLHPHISFCFHAIVVIQGQTYSTPGLEVHRRNVTTGLGVFRFAQVERYRFTDHILPSVEALKKELSA